MSLIPATDLRAVVGKEYKVWSRLLPIVEPDPKGGDNCRYHLPSGSLLSETYRGKSLSPQAWEEIGKHFDDRQQAGLSKLLCTNIGLSSRAVKILVRRPRVQYLRIEEFISGLVDCLWLVDHKIFLRGSQDLLLIKALVRKIYRVGTYNLGLLVDDYKKWSNHLYHKHVMTQTIGDVEIPAGNNIFNRLNGVSAVAEILKGDRSMLLMQHLSHLVSSRQFPYMGKRTEEKSYARYKHVLESDFKPDPSIVIDLGKAAFRIGRICRKISPGPINEGTAHCSVTSSGESEHSLARGAQAAAVREALLRVLNRVPEVDEEEITPFGKCQHKQGIQVWKTLFQDELTLSDRMLDELFAPQLKGYSKDQPLRYCGLDRVTGKQLLYTAWVEYCRTGLPVVCRAEVVPEMGNKARWVTLTPYWVNVLQAPLAHVLVEAMKWHPSCFSSFHRQDQAWEATKGIFRIKDYRLDDETQSFLSSDLKDATNAQNWEITKVMLSSFMNGYGMLAKTAYVDLVLNMIGSRLVLFREYDSILSKTGIMMGEAIAKPSLTLLNLSIEELAFLKHCRATECLEKDEPAPYRAWRFFHLGGDDHLAKGPMPYLKLITQIHLDAGSHISPGQHGYSRIAVRYCERLLWLENLPHGQPFNKTDYALSTVVDSVKVRLLERGQSTMIKKDNKNVAIGKSTQISGCLAWLPDDNRFFTLDKKVSIRNLFIKRMGRLLPSFNRNPRAFAAIHLPIEIGGFGLGFPWELKKFLLSAPDPQQWIVKKALLGLDISADIRIFRKLNTNTSVRGIDMLVEYQEILLEQLRMFPNMVNAISWKELVLRFPSENNNPRECIALAQKENVFSFDEFVKRVSRGDIFQALLQGEKLKVFNTRPYVQTYRHVWSEAEDLGLNHYCGVSLLDKSDKDILWAIRSGVPQWFLDISQETHMDFGFRPLVRETEVVKMGNLSRKRFKIDPSEEFDFRGGTYEDKFKGGPDLSVGFRFLGLKY